MQYEVKIDPQLWKVYPEIRLGVMQFDTTVKKSDAQFWNHVDKEVLPQVQQAIEGKEWGEFPVFVVAVQHIKHLVAIRGDIVYRLRH